MNDNHVPGADDQAGAQPRSPRKHAERSAAEYALLGLIAQTDAGEIHGYDLSRSFSEGVLGKIVRLESGMLYHFLKKLAKAGFITTRIEHQIARPDRQVHTLTAEGETLLRSWMTAPVRATREIRIEFLLKLYLARQLDPDLGVALVRDQLAIMQKRTNNLLKQVNDPQPAGPVNEFGETVLRLRLIQTQAALQWLESLPEST